MRRHSLSSAPWLHDGPQGDHRIRMLGCGPPSSTASLDYAALALLALDPGERLLEHPAACFQLDVGDAALLALRQAAPRSRSPRAMMSSSVSVFASSLTWRTPLCWRHRVANRRSR
jgi:hypothetical protein